MPVFNRARPLMTLMVLVTMFLAVGVTFAAPARASDMAGPVLVSQSVTWTNLNHYNGPVTINTTIHLRDDTGVETPVMIASWVNPDPEAWSGGQSQGFGRMTLVSGTMQDGIWKHTITIPQGAATGQWAVKLYPLDDTWGNNSTFFKTLATVTVTDEAPPTEVSPAAVTFTGDTYAIPTKAGVDYLISDRTIAAGTYPGTGTLTVTAKARQGYIFPAGATTSWTASFKAVPFPATPAAVTFTDNDGTTSDTYTIPATTGVDYLIGGKVTPSGTYPGTGTVTVTAKARQDYILSAGTPASWTLTFKTTPVFAIPNPGAQVAVKPFRALDTRSTKPVAAESTVSFQVGGVNGIPKNVSAVVFNLTVTEAKSFGFVTAYASGTTRPDASNVNYSTGQTVANLVAVPVGADGKVTLSNRSKNSAQLIADVSGYYIAGKATAPGAFQPVAPSRYLDTRSTKPVAAESTVSFQVGGVNGIPKNVSAVVFNLTVTEAKSFGFITAYASGTTRPDASNLNYSTGQTIPNLVTVPVGADGKVTLSNRSKDTAQLIADVSGYYIAGKATAPGTFQPVAPSRYLDTRSSKPVAAESTVSFQVGGVNGIPKNVSAVVFNLTVTEAKSFGFITAYAAGTTRPDASNLNYSTGQTIPNLVTVPVGADGKVTLSNRSKNTAQLIADVSGYYIAGQTTAP